MISHFGDRAERRDEAAEWVGVSARTVDAWCCASDPRVISADMLMELAVGATINQASIMEADKIYDVVNDGEIITSLRDVGHAAYIADLRGYEVVRRDGKPVRMTEEQQVRSRLRKIIASGHLTLRQISQWVGGNEYAVVDRIMEVRSRTHKNLYDFTVDRIDREIRHGYDANWDWIGAAA
ncbi:hypothetical protein ELI02_02060 [Rhizobium leguminosarum]|uniref:hypothetical protein n=1 Tax=Rhizobium leguminosarum TaxID=384 RepID=UPI001030F20A|nr:hypothetical protein [Rhizobium leguminosarum]TAX58904.1 hypothetical protein ELI02_02060 [Rhizobium leguminosarum]